MIVKHDLVQEISYRNLYKLFLLIFSFFGDFNVFFIEKFRQN